MRTLNCLTLLFFICSYACGQSNRATLPPVETKDPNTEYKPAFAGQTRINSVKTSTAYNAERIATQMRGPWAIIPLPDGRLLITLKSGSMQLHDADGKLLKEITGLPEVVNRGQIGLLDVALDPDFKSNKIIYWSYAEKNENGNLLAVAKGSLNEA